MRKLSFLIGCALCLVMTSPSGAQKREMKVLQSWTGTVADEKLLAEAPGNAKGGTGMPGVVSDDKAWAKLWTTWRGDDMAPKIDFAKELVIVFALGGPNEVTTFLKVDGAGNLNAAAVATLRGGDGFCYRIVTVSRVGLKSVNGNAIK